MPPRTYRLELEPRVATGAVPGDAEIAAYYAATCPPGGPPLAAIRDHVIAAMQQAAPVDDADPGQAAALELDLLYSLREDFELVAARPAQLEGVRWLEVAEAQAMLRAIADAVAGDPRGPRRRRLFAPEDVRAGVLAQLAALQAQIAQLARRCRLAIVPRTLSLDDQLAALAAGGIAPRPGTPRDALIRNWSEAEIAEAPWRRLDDVLEHTDDLGGVALRSIETHEDRGVYGSIARQVASLARGRLPLEDIASDVDFERGIATLAFTLDGARHELSPRWNGAWFDVEILARLAALLRARAPGWDLYHLLADPSSEGMVLAVLAHDAALRLRAAGVPISGL